MPDTEVASAFVTIGGKTDGLKQAFAKSEQITRSSLSGMGRQIGDFAARFGDKLGLGLGGGFAAVAAVAVKSSETIKGSLATIGQRAGELGVDVSVQLKIVDDFLIRFSRLIPLTKNEALAMGALGLQFGFAGDRLRKLMGESVGLAEGFTTPIDAMRIALEALTKGGVGDALGVFARGTANQVFEAIEQTGARRQAAVEKRGGARPGKGLETITAGAGEFFGALTEFVQEDVIAAKRQTEGTLRKGVSALEDAGAFVSGKPHAGILGGILTGASALADTITKNVADPFGGFRSLFGGGAAQALRGRQQIFERESAGATAAAFDDRATAETGVSGGERSLRKPRAAGGGGTESEALSSAMETLRDAVQSNTKALESAPQGSIVREQP